jgi:hypothetical protein
MLQIVLDAEMTRAVRRWVLATRDTHAFYADYGFVTLAAPERRMERAGGRH